MKRTFCIVLIVAVVFCLCACGRQTGQAEDGTQPIYGDLKPVIGTSSLKELVDVCNSYIDSKGDRSIIDSVLDKQMCLAINLEDDLYRGDMETAKEKADLILKGADSVQKEDPDLAAWIVDAYCSFNETGEPVPDTALDWLLEVWLYKFDDSWAKYYSPDEYDFEEYESESEIKTFTLGSVENPDENYSFRLEINYEVKDGKYYLVSFDSLY